LGESLSVCEQLNKEKQGKQRKGFGLDSSWKFEDDVEASSIVGAGGKQKSQGNCDLAGVKKKSPRKAAHVTTKNKHSKVCGGP